MTMKSELDETEGKAFDGTLSRDRDPVVPRGAVVAGEGEGEGNAPSCAHLRVSYTPSHNDDGTVAPRWACWTCESEFVPLLPAQARIRALEEANRSARETATVRLNRILNLEAENAALEAERNTLATRLEECRPVVRAARRQWELTPSATTPGLRGAILTLSPATREWAEGEE